MIIAGQLFKSAHIRRVLPAAFPAVEVSSYDQLMAFIGSSVGEDRRMRFGKRFNITESDNINFLSQSDKLLIIMEDGIGIFKLAGSIYFRVITVYADPGLFAFFFDNLLMMLQFTYCCDYYRERFRIYCGAEPEDMNPSIRKEMLKFLESAFTFEEQDK